jgi:superfamily II DNA helicase RecQ
MQDQMKKLPVHLPAACFSGWGATSSADLGKLTAAVVKGFVKVLFVSPERLCTEAFRSLIRALKREARSKVGAANPIALLCLDEAHCKFEQSFQ